jgi:ribonuclease HII
MLNLTNNPEELDNLEFIAGVDEVGRGCLSGPVFAAAVILPKDFKSEIIKDSKKLSEKARLKAYEDMKRSIKTL